jgi:hypothetical protein
MVTTPANSTTEGDKEGEPTRDLRPAGQAGAPRTEAPPYTVRKDNITFDTENPNIARAVRRRSGDTESRQSYDEYVARMRRAGRLDLIEGSDSERTGTTWGLPAVDDWPTVNTPEGELPEGTGPGRAGPNRNTGRRGGADPTYMVGSWSTIDDEEGRMSGGSPAGNS